MASINMEDYKDYTVVVRISKTGDTVSGLINNEELSYATSANIGNSSLIGGLSNIASSALKGGAGALANRAGGEYARQKTSDALSSLDNVYSTLKSYEGGSSAPPPVTFHIFPENGSYQSALKTLYRLTQPDTEDGIMIRSYLYSEKDIADVDRDGVDPHDGKLVHLMIGNWFHATGLFVSGVSLNFSKYVDSSKVPIYAEVTISFDTHISLNAKQMLAWHTR